MPLIIVGAGILLLLILIVRYKINPFFALLFTCFFVGLFNGMSLIQTLDSILHGIGDTMGKIILILTFGAMLGKLIEESGAAHTITHRLVEKMGLGKIQYAILITGFLVGLPMMYNASFLVMIHLIYAFASKTKLPLMYLGIPLSATLSIAHAYLPPHPAPTYISFIYEADINMVLLYGLVPVIPACLFAGIFLSKFFKHLDNKPPAELYQEKEFKKEDLPGLRISILAAATPVVLMLFGAVIDMTLEPPPPKSALLNAGYLTLNEFYRDLLGGYQLSDLWVKVFSAVLVFFKFLSDANIALFMAVLVGIFTLGLRNGRKMDDVMQSLGKSVGSIGMIIMIIAAGGAFSQVLKDGEISSYIAYITSDLQMNPLVLSFCVAALIRLAVGSATVATMTAAPIMVPIAAQSGIAPELMVLATGSGSLMFSHFNDIGFWMFKEYYNVSIKQTFQIWTVMECLVAMVGLACALLLNMII
ncbi:MAG: gluconate permease [Cyclobacteriaceae bacterium]|nr:gluconate permease [Cyclobacteriaceae bacterium]